jgi:23S rRNA pseudouridine1911/1915/1917 synthase
MGFFMRSPKITRDQIPRGKINSGGYDQKSRPLPIVLGQIHLPNLVLRLGNRFLSLSFFMSASENVIRKSLLVSSRIPPPGRRMEALVQQLLQMPRQQCLAAIRDGAVRVNGKFDTRGARFLEEGDLIEIEYSPPPVRQKAVSADRRSPVEIVYEDEAILVVHKPPALLTVPTLMRESRTVISDLNRMLQRRHPAESAFVVHRLDRGVSGLLVFAKSVEIAETMRNQFAARKPKRQYHALVYGVVDADKGTFESFLATDENLNRYSTDDEESGQHAITHYRVLRRFADATYVEVWLETGRRNQIRVHFAEAGHPLIGDERYARERPEHPQWKSRRIALHALTLGIDHPVTGKPLHFESRLPEEFESFFRSQNKSETAKTKRGK